ncbi:MAG: mechanosensitive ion channel family protein [bacterium]
MSFSEFVQLILNIFKYPLFRIGDMQVTLTSLIMFGVWLAVFAALSKFLKKGILNLLSKTQIDEGTRYIFARIAQYAVIIFGALLAFQFVGIDLSGLAVIFGFLSVGIGFGLQNITSNFVAGLILLFERPIKVGDRLMVGDVEGDVVEINIRSTTVRTINNVHIIVPNSDFISNNVVNWSFGDKKVRIEIAVGVSYDSDLDTVLQSLQEVADENHEVLKKPAPEVLLMNFGDSSWDMQLRVWIKDPKRHRNVRSDLNCAIVHKFRQNHVEIPFPQRDLHVRSPLPVPLSSSNQQKDIIVA